VASKNSAAAALDLPSEQDVHRARAWESDTVKLARLIGYVAMRRPVWWSRGRFFKEPFRDVAPKHHVFAGRIRSADPSPQTRWDFTWRGLCGYEFVRTEIISGLGSFTVTPPKKSERCARCDKTVADIRARDRAAAA